MNALRVEYIALVDDEKLFCTNIDSFNSLLQSDPRIAISNGSLVFDGVKFPYSIQLSRTSTGSQRLFHVELECADFSLKRQFEALLKAVRSLMYLSSGKDPHLVWNDLGLHYAQQAYGILYVLENSMRKLITKFMLLSVGVGWAREATPKEVAESLRSKVDASSVNFLQHVDFIQLSNFLFKPYASVDAGRVLDKLAKSKLMSDLNLKELQSLVPRSNWERHFRPLVDCESEYLRVRWERLYEYRNHVAHNRAISAADLHAVKELDCEVRPKVEAAIVKLRDLVLTDIEKEAVAENVAGQRNVASGEFLELWKKVHECLVFLGINKVSDEHEKARVIRLSQSVISLVNILRQQRVITAVQSRILKDSNGVRNLIIHHSYAEIPASQMQVEFNKLREVLAQLEWSRTMVDLDRDETRSAGPEGGECQMPELSVQSLDAVESSDDA